MPAVDIPSCCWGLENEIRADETGAAGDENQDDLSIAMSYYFMGSLRAAARNE